MISLILHSFGFLDKVVFADLLTGQLLLFNECNTKTRRSNPLRYELLATSEIQVFQYP